MSMDLLIAISKAPQYVKVLCEICEKEAEHRQNTLHALTRHLASSAEKIDILTQKMQKTVDREASRELKEDEVS